MVVAEKRKDKPCNHAESMNFLCQDNPSYFTTTYINGNKSWPWSCLQCSIEFGRNYKVNNKHPVMVCENAAKHDHVCMCAMCIHCYNKCKAMRNNHHEEQDDQETSSLFLFFLYIILFRPSINNKRN